MNISITLALATMLASQPRAETPSLEGTVGIGLGIGAIRYDGTVGDENSVYGRAFMVSHPLEWLGVRATGGFGNFGDGGQTDPAFETVWFSNLGLDLVLQPRLGMGGFRPYVASGVSTTFGTARLDGIRSQNLDWNLYVPVELGLEYLIAQNLSIWVWGETYAYMDKFDRIDGVASTGDYYHRRDELQKVGVGFSFMVGSKTDADKDGVPDASDQCPGTPPGVKIDYKGCPLDGDHDGVPDYKDLCPTTSPGASVDAVGCPLDSDKDGVMDLYDKCPNTPVGVKVDADGCPAAAPDADKDGVPDSIDKCPGTLPGSTVDETGCVMDSDKDGVGDDMDLCRNTPAGTKVDSKGCPLPVADSDHDGVADSLDKCPGTRVGTRVDTNGCTEIVIVKGAKLVIDGIVFKTGSAVIDNVSAPVLARAAVAISKAPTEKIEIAGFTDDVGSSTSNQKLSERRAASVKAYLVKAGVPASRLAAKGYGEKDPIVDNSTSENRSENRRIEFHVK